MTYTYDGPKGPTRRAYLLEPGWSPPPPRPEPLPERCRVPLTFYETRSAYGPTPFGAYVDPEGWHLDPYRGFASPTPAQSATEQTEEATA